MCWLIFSAPVAYMYCFAVCGLLRFLSLLLFMLFYHCYLFSVAKDTHCMRICVYMYVEGGSKRSRQRDKRQKEMKEQLTCITKRQTP